MKPDTPGAGCCGCLGLMVVIVVAIIAAAWFLADEPTSPTSEPPPVATAMAPPAGPTPTPTPRGATWTITSNTVKVGSNYRFVDVVLSQRVSESELTAIAEHIRQQSAGHPVVHILYWIDGMDTDNGAWATTRFEPGQAVDVRIYDFQLTPTPSPTLTATPRPTPAPTRAPQACGAFEQTYLRVLDEDIRTIAAGALRLVDLFQRLEQNPSLLQDLDFTIDFAIIGGQVNNVAKAILDRPKPQSTRLAAIHDRSRTMARSLSVGLTGMMDGISRANNGTIIAGSHQVETAGREIQAIRQLAEDACA